MLARVRSALQWQALLDARVLSDELGLSVSEVSDSLRVLDACGLAG